MRKIGCVLVLVFFACSLLALLSGGNQTAPSEPGVTPTPTLTAAEKATRGQEASKALATYLFENFGGAGNARYATSWYMAIKSIAVRFDSHDEAEVIVDTPYVAGKKDQLAERSANTIATVIANSGQIPAKNIHVTVYGQNGVVGAWTFYEK